MLNSLKCFLNMEYLLNTGWLVTNLTALYIGLKARLTFLAKVVETVSVEEVKYWALVLGIISSVIYIGFMLSKWYQQVLETKAYKNEHNIEKLFKFAKEAEKKIKNNKKEIKNK